MKVREIGQKIREAVRAGKLTKEQGAAKWKATVAAARKHAAANAKAQPKRRAAQKQPHPSERLARLGKALKAAVSAGKLSKEEAHKKWKAAITAMKKAAAKRKAAAAKKRRGL